MTISTTVTTKQALANGITTVFNFPFKVFALTDLIVGQIDVSGTYTQIISGYTVSGIDNDTGGSVTFAVAPVAGLTIDMRAVTPQTQPAAIGNYGKFLPETHEEAFDRLTREVQDLSRRTYDFGIHGPDIESAKWPALPSAAARANSQMIFDSNGLPATGVLTTSFATKATVIGLLQDSGYRYLITPTEIAAGLTAGNLTFGFDPGNVLRYGADPTGVATSDAALAAATSVCGAAGGTIQFPSGTFRFASTYNYQNKQNIIWQGQGGVGAGAQCSTFIIYTGTASPFLDWSGAFGCSIRDCQVIFTNTGFAGGTLIKNGHGTTDSFMNTLVNCSIGGSTAASITHVDLDGATNFTATNCMFNYGAPSIAGRKSAGSNYAVNIKFIGCQWNNSRTVPIFYGGAAWSFIGCTFEQLLSGAAGAFLSGASVASDGLNFEGCWMGDVTVGGGVWVSVLGSAFRFSGNYISTTNVSGLTTTGISLNGVIGFEITGNHFENLANALSFDTSQSTAGVFKGNKAVSVGTYINNPTNAPTYFDCNPNSPLVSSITNVQLFGTHGFYYTNNGVLKQWGVATVTTGTPLAITFDKAYGTLWGIQMTLYTPSGAGNTTYATSATTAGFSANVNGTAGTSTVYWEAIGN